MAYDPFKKQPEKFIDFGQMSDDTVIPDAEDNNEISQIEAGLAGVASGILKIPEGFSLVASSGLAGATLSIFMWSLNPLSDFQCSTDRSRNLLSRVADTTNFVTTWVICGFLTFEIFIYFTEYNLKAFFEIWLPFVPLIAILFGFLPGCGPQIIVTTFYLNGFIPLSAEIGNAISNDGDALFPAIALAPKAAVLATLYSAVPAVLIAYSYMFLFE